MDVRTSYIEKLEKEKPNGKCRKWRLWIRLSDGKKRSRRFTGAYREAQQALSTFRAEVESEVKSTGTFAGCAESWLAYRESMGDVRFSTLRRNRNAITALSREFGDVPLADMTPERCRDGLAAIRNGNNATGRVLGGAYMAKLYSVLHRVLLMALHDGKIARDPLANVPAPKVDTREKAWLPPDELASTVRALEALPMDGKVICYLLMCYLGLRRGECVALLVEDVDLDASIVHVRHGIEERDMSVSDTKTRAGVRDLPMPAPLVGDLRKWLAIRDGRARADCPTLAINARGAALRSVDLEKWWNAHRAALGADGMTMHQLRHSNLSMMARHMNVFDLQRWAGWSSIAPARVYVHADQESLAAGCADAYRHHFGTS